MVSNSVDIESLLKFVNEMDVTFYDRAFGLVTHFLEVAVEALHSSNLYMDLHSLT